MRWQRIATPVPTNQVGSYRQPTGSAWLPALPREQTGITPDLAVKENYLPTYLLALGTQLPGDVGNPARTPASGHCSSCLTVSPRRTNRGLRKLPNCPVSSFVCQQPCFPFGGWPTSAEWALGHCWPVGRAGRDG